jgi:hypothetical protein
MMIRKSIKVVLLYICVYTPSLDTQMVIPTNERLNVTPISTYFSPVDIVVDVKPYATGGVSFSYETGVFTQAPMISVALEDFSLSLTTTDVFSVSLSTTQAAVAWVTENDKDHTKVIAVMSNGSGGFEEMPNNGVNVHIRATGSSSNDVVN